MDLTKGFIITMRAQGMGSGFVGAQQLISTKTLYNNTDGFEITAVEGTTPADMWLQLSGSEGVTMSAASGDYNDNRYITCAYNVVDSEVHYIVGDGPCTTASVTTALTNETSGVCIGNDAALAAEVGTNEGEWLIEHVFFCEGNFNPGDVQSLHRDPYQILKSDLPDFYFTPGAAGTTLNPSVGTFTATGQTATAVTDALPAPSNGSFSISGQTITIGHGLNPSSATYTIAGQTVTIGFGLNPGVDSISIAGQDVTVAQNAVIGPSSVSLTINGQAVTINGVLVDDNGLVIAIVDRQIVQSIISDLIF